MDTSRSSRSPGVTGRRNFALSMPRKYMSEFDESNGSLAYARIPPICASASTMSTPGMMGRPGKCPWNHGSPIVTHLCPTMRSPGTTSITRSTSTNGQRCGRIWRIRSISIVVLAFNVSPSCRVKLCEAPEPAHSRHRGVSCHDVPCGDIAGDAALGGYLRAAADDDVVGDAHLPADAHAGA